MSAYDELRRLLGQRKAEITGTVLTVAGQSLAVQTARGTIEARSPDATVYLAGDEVLLRDGIVLGRVKPAASVPVYEV